MVLRSILEPRLDRSRRKIFKVRWARSSVALAALLTGTNFCVPDDCRVNPHGNESLRDQKSSMLKHDLPAQEALAEQVKIALQFLIAVYIVSHRARKPNLHTEPMLRWMGKKKAA